MGRIQSPLVDQLNKKLAHRLWREQVAPALRLAKARKVDGKKMCVLGKQWPDWQKRIQALRKCACQENEAILLACALSIADSHSVCCSEPGLHDLVHWDIHAVSPFSTEITYLLFYKATPPPG